jgi:NodT family efflux transporter outer membrane factor (OMF) lipoprotein
VTLPAQWQSGVADPLATPASAHWWRRFNSAELERLIGTALENNRDLKAAASRIAQARALARLAGANLLPEVAVQGDIARARGAGDSTSSSRSNAEIGARFELDLWGKNHQAHEAALGRVQGSIHAQGFVKLQLQADVSIAYFQALSARDRLALARGNLSNAESLLRLLQVQYQAGAISALEIERQQGLIASVRASIPPIELERQGAVGALAILLGRAPQGFSVSTDALASVQIPGIAAGLPSALLERRSDIRQAEANLIAANADLNAARAAFFPSIRLTAVAGVASDALTSALHGGSLIYLIAAGFTAPIFDNGRVQGGVDLAQARQDELVHAYQQSILVALREVEDGLAAMQRLAEQTEHQQQLIAHSQAALRMAEVRYRDGAVDFTTVLDAQRVLLAAETAQEQITLSRYIAAIALFRALGGGWEEPPQSLTASSATPSPR